MIIADSPDAYDRLARNWAPGAPFPVLAGPSLERYAGALLRRGALERPPVDTRPRDGVVISLGDGAGRTIAGLLARATGRPHLHVRAEELAGVVERHSEEPIALVGLAGEFNGLGDWPGHLAPRLGVVTGRDAAALSCLVYRTLTVNALGPARDFTLFHPGDPEADDADAVGGDELDGLKGEPLRLLAMRVHGMECSVNLPDGILCGRSDFLGLPLPGAREGQRAVSCLNGAGCYRKDLREDQRIPVSDFDAGVVFAQSCMSVAVGNNVFPGEVGFGLGFLSGTSVAVIGTIGKHLEDVAYLAEFRAALADGLPLGDALARVNRLALRVGGEMSRFGLLGDPAIVLESAARSGAASAAEPYREVDTAELAHLGGTVLPRLRRLRWLDVEVPETELAEVEALIRSALADGGQSTGEVAARVAALQAGIAASVVKGVHGSWWHFTQSALPAFRRLGDEAVRCPTCGLDSAFLARFEHRAEPELRISTVQCRRCGDLTWSTEDGVTWESPHVTWATRGETQTVRATVTNTTERALSGGVGFAISAGGFLNLPEGWSAECALEPGGARELTWELEAASDVVPHEYEGWSVRVLDGIYSASTMQVEVR